MSPSIIAGCSVAGLRRRSRPSRGFSCGTRLRRRRRIPEMACRSLAAGPSARGFARHLRHGDARPRAGFEPAGSRFPGPRGRAAARAGRVRADSGRLRQRKEHRLSCRAGKEARRPARPHARRDRAAIRRARERAAGDLGPRDRFGGYRLPKNAITVLATQGYYGRRKDMFRQELLYAFKMLEEGHVKFADMRSSWGARWA